MQPIEIMRATDAIGTIGAAFYFHPDTLARGKEHGLSGMRFYAVGRGGVLGDVDASVIGSAFGYFHPDLLAKWWDQGCERMSPRDAARLYHECAHGLGRSKLTDVEGLDDFVAAVTAIIDSVEGASLPLFAGVRAEPVPDDAPAAALHQAMVLRELRGSVHLLCIVAEGLDTSVAHAIKRPDDVAMFGYEEPPVVTDADREAWARAESATDRLLTPAYAALTDDQTEALVAGTAAIAAALGL